jgi:hypothetical protein
MDHNASVKKAKWIKPVAIIGLILSGLGIFSAAQSFVAPRILEFQQETMESFEKAQKEAASANPRDSSANNAAPFLPVGPLKSWIDVPPWFRQWSIINGYAGIVISFGHFVACILLLTLNPAALRYFPIFAALAISWNIIRIVVGSSSQSAMLIVLIPAGIFSVLIHGTLLFIFRRGDKSKFMPQSTQLHI